MKKLSKILSYTVVILTILTLLTIIIANLFCAYDHPTISFLPTNIPLLLLGLVLIPMSIFAVYKITAKFKISNKHLHIILLIYSAILSAIIITLFWAPLSSSIDARNASQGQDFIFWGTSTYVEFFHQQIGLNLLYILLFSIFGLGNFWFIYVINIALIVISMWFLPKISEKLFKKSAYKITIISLFFALPFFILAIWPYNDLLAIALAIMAVYYQLVYFDKRTALPIIISSVCIALAVILRSNTLIIFIAIMLGYIYDVIQHKKINLKLLIPLGIVIASQIMLTPFVTLVYGKFDSDRGQTPLYWVAMSLQDKNSLNEQTDFSQPGLWNGYSNDVRQAYLDLHPGEGHNFVYDEPGRIELHKADIAKRLKTFAADPLYALEFFGKKMLVSFADPSLGVNEILAKNAKVQTDFINKNLDAYIIFTSRIGTQASAARENPAILQSNITRSAEDGIMDGTAYNLIIKPWYIIILVSIFAAVIVRRKKLTPTEIVLLSAFLGGFIFHVFLWETRSRYIIIYIILLLPLVAPGLQAIYEKLKLTTLKIKQLGHK